jgi:20S proteasome alpha/beta subunit
MNRSDVEKSLKDVEELLRSSLELPDAVELAIRKLLNLVEALCSDKQELLAEVERLRKQLEEKKRGKNSSATRKTHRRICHRENANPPIQISRLACFVTVVLAKSWKSMRPYLAR